MEQSSHPEYDGSANTGQRERCRYELKTEDRRMDQTGWRLSAAKKKLCPDRGPGPQLAGRATLPKCSFDCERRMIHVGEISLLYRAVGLCSIGKDERTSWECLPEEVVRVCRRGSLYNLFISSLAILKLTVIEENFIEKLNKFWSFLQLKNIF